MRSPASKTGSGTEIATFTDRSMNRSYRSCQTSATGTLLVRGEQSRGALDLCLARQEGFLERRRIGNGSVESADDADGGVEILEGFLLDDGGEAFSDRAGARVFVYEEHAATMAREREQRVAIERNEAAQVEDGGLGPILGEL